MKQLLLVLLACTTYLTAGPGSAPATSSDRLIHARRYFHNSELQRQWTASLLRDMQIHPAAFILDYGCRDGKIAADLTLRVPKGYVLGVESDEEFLIWAMRKYPKANFPNLTFTWAHEYIMVDDVSPVFDVVVSVNRLQRENDPRTTLEQLRGLTQPGGHLYLTIPGAQLHEPFQLAFAEVRDEYSITSQPRNTEIREVAVLRDMLESVGYRVLRCEEIVSSERFVDLEELHGWVMGSLIPTWNVPEYIAEEFCTAGIERYLDKKPSARRLDGTIVVPMRRIEVHAIRK